MIDEGVGVGKRETGLKKKLPGLLTGKGEKQRGDETHNSTGMCVCLRVHAFERPSARKEGRLPGRAEHPPT